MVSLAFYGMSTFEGPMMAIKTVNSLSHYTDWTIGHVHAGALGWVAMISIGTLYHMIPKLWGRERMHSVGLINAHFWLATIGTVLYIASMWVNGITQGLMWRAVNEDGTLTYSFVEALVASHPGYVVRLLGGATFASAHAADGPTTPGGPCAARRTSGSRSWRPARGLNMLLSLLCLSTLALGLALSLASSTREERETGRPAAVRRRSRGRPPGRPGYRQDLPAWWSAPSRNPARPPARRSSPEPTPSSRDGCLQHESALRGRQRPFFRFEEFHERLPSTASTHLQRRLPP